MVHKIALFVASLAASLALAVALTAAGFGPAAGPAPTPVATAAAADTNQTADVVAPPQVQVDKVYIAPAKPRQTVTVHKIVKTTGGESEGSEGGD
jgi:hypothetical protein